jgi:hypothetical protein
VKRERRGAGKPVAQIARACAEAAQRGLPLDDAIAELRWLTPLITTVHAHLETFAVARLPAAQRLRLMQAAVAILRNRWLPLLRAEADGFAAKLPALNARAHAAPEPLGRWMRQQIGHVARAIATVMPEAAAVPSIAAE